MTSSSQLPIGFAKFACKLTFQRAKRQRWVTTNPRLKQGESAKVVIIRQPVAGAMCVFEGEFQAIRIKVSKR